MCNTKLRDFMLNTYMARLHFANALKLCGGYRA